MELTAIRSVAIVTLRQLTTALNPPVCVLDVIASIENVIQDLRCILLKPEQTLAHDSDSLTERQEAALAHIWKIFRRHRTALPAIQELVSLAEVSVRTFDGTQTLRNPALATAPEHHVMCGTVMLCL